jgi:starch phosphorylase
MKAAVNGVLNLSVLDGWWAEGYSPEVGWAIDGVSDEADVEQLYRLLERDVVPTFVDRRERWLEMMKASIAELAPRFSMQRAVIEYVERYYLPAHTQAHVGV